MGIYYGMNGLWVPVGGQGGQASDLSVITAAAGDVRQDKIFIDSNGQQTVGTLITRKSENITSSNNIITIPAGIYDSQVQKTIGTAKSAATYTPTTENQAISAGQYLTGDQTIKGDSNLVANNIKSGISIFGVSGSLESNTIYQDQPGTANFETGVTTSITPTNTIKQLLSVRLHKIISFTFDGTRYYEYFDAYANTTDISNGSISGFYVRRDRDAAVYDLGAKEAGTLSYTSNRISITFNSLLDNFYNYPTAVSVYLTYTI